MGDELILRKSIEEKNLKKETHPDYRAIIECNLKTTEELLALTMQEYRSMKREINREK